MNEGTGIEVVWVTPTDIAVTIGLGLLLALLAAGLGWWARGGVEVEDCADEGAPAEVDEGAPAEVDEGAPAEVDEGADPEGTVEIRPRGCRRPLSPGTICAPGVTPPPDPTVVLDTSAVRDAR